MWSFIFGMAGFAVIVLAIGVLCVIGWQAFNDLRNYGNSKPVSNTPGVVKITKQQINHRYRKERFYY